MPKEIERKFLVACSADRWAQGDAQAAQKATIRQGYLAFSPEVRVRMRKAKGALEAFLTIKSEGGLSRQEFEYQIPSGDAERLFKMVAGKAIVKARLALGRWEVDLYGGHLVGLIVAEVELRDESEAVPPLEGVSLREVTEDPRFKNKNLARINSPADLGLRFNERLCCWE